MILNKKELIYGGIGVFLFLVIYSSTRNNKTFQNLVEVDENLMTKKNFDNFKLPKKLQPPKKLMEGEPIPEGAKRKNNNIQQPRFDNW